jgi:hypothetical protein
VPSSEIEVLLPPLFVTYRTKSQGSGSYETHAASKSNSNREILKEAKRGMQWDAVTSIDVNVDGRVNMSLKCYLAKEILQ